MTKRSGRILVGATADGRPPLSRATIIASAVEFIDRRGLPAVTMRSLGEFVGVEAMSLYRYVNGREDLLEGVVQSLVGRLHLDPGKPAVQPADGWQAYLQWLAHSVRALAHEHPDVFPLIATRHPAAPWLRPPLRSLEVVEDFLSALTTRGFSDESAVNAYRAFSSFLLGHLLLEVASRGASTAPVEQALDESDAEVPEDTISLDDYTETSRLRPLLSQDRDDQEFEMALENLLDRLDLLVSR